MHRNFKLIKSFISQAEAKILMGEIDLKFKSTVYNSNHYDRVIRNYRETTFSALDPSYAQNRQLSLPQKIITRLRDEIFSVTSTTEYFQVPHVLDLNVNSQIDAHIDSIQSAGSVIATLSLLSPTIIIFKNPKSGDEFKCLIPPDSLYMHWGELRYEYTHEIPVQGKDHQIDGKVVERGRRVAIIQRTFKSPV